MRKLRTMLLAAAMALTALLSACETPGNNSPDNPAEDEDGAFIVTARVAAAQNTMDPAYVTAQGGDTILYHLYENLLRWTDGGDGYAVLAPGQAEDWSSASDFAGSTTYTFTLREGLCWSDGAAVTAQDFVAAWRRLADPAAESPHRGLLAAIAGYDQVQSTGDTSLLEVSAPDERTFVVRLAGSCAWFLSDVCASAYTVPTRDDATNGPYTLARREENAVVLARSTTYYDHLAVGPEELRFVAVPDDGDAFAQFQAEEIDLISGLPSEALADMPENWVPEPASSVYAVLLNTHRAPFDNPDVRLAFRLAVDGSALADAAGDPTFRPAAGVVPYGVADYGDRPVQASPADGTPQPNAVPAEEKASTYWDFRAHSLEKVTVPDLSDYESDCLRARQLLVSAGYPNGEGLPEIEYIYVDTGPAKAVAEALRDMWRSQLGATVTLKAVSPEAYAAALLPAVADGDGDAADTEDSSAEDGEAAAPATGLFTMAAQMLTPASNDAGSLLELWYGGSENNITGYASEHFDILLDAAQSAVSTEARDGFLHDAEAILFTDAPVIPLVCPGGSYRLAEQFSGLYRAPDGVFFLAALRR